MLRMQFLLLKSFCFAFVWYLVYTWLRYTTLVHYNNKTITPIARVSPTQGRNTKIHYVNLYFHFHTGQETDTKTKLFRTGTSFWWDRYREIRSTMQRIQHSSNIKSDSLSYHWRTRLNGIILDISTESKDAIIISFSFQYYGIRQQQLRAICAALTINTYVKRLILQDNWTTPDGAFYLGEMLRENYTITVLNLRECRLGVEGKVRLTITYTATPITNT